MATRSGKRIHSSFGNIEQPDMDKIVKSERKSRSKRQKENCTELSTDLNKKVHYVFYPGNEENVINDANENVVKSTRKLRRHTLKEQNIIVANSDDNIEIKKKKNSRRSKKLVEETMTDIPEVAMVNKEPEVKQKVKRNKKKKQEIVSEPVESDNAIIDTAPKTKKKSKNKKNSKRSSSAKLDDVKDVKDKKDAKDSPLNKSSVSVDSFHSAAGSPTIEKINGVIQIAPETDSGDHVTILHESHKKSTPRLSKRKSSTVVDNTKSDCGIFVDTKEKGTAKRKLSIKETTFDKTVNMSISDKNHNESSKKILTMNEKSTLDNSIAKNDYLEKVISSSERKSACLPALSAFNSKHSLNSTFDKISHKPKHNKTMSLDLTFDKDSSNGKLNLTFNKDEKIISNRESEVINVTFDKSNNNSHISINSNDSNTENIVNLTPELIESSIDISSIHNSPQIPPKIINKENEVPITLLKREGTYTKESPLINETPNPEEPEIPKTKNMETPNPKLSADRASNRRNSMPPSHTPSSSIKNTEADKTGLNLTHSIDKSLRRSSLMDPVPRTNKVMFCSPVNSQTVHSQIKRKVIKSNLKGSNKSFVFEESVLETRNPSARKRSYTQSDADESRCKRSRLGGDELQQSVDRLSRPRTYSASAKLSEPSSTPSKKTTTPSKTKPENKMTRTKLPNFAALHKKRFDKMESLDECQERKAKRARQLLTPTGSVNLLERISPKENIDESPKRALKERKPDTPYRPKLPTLASLNPGYTRFGFKMNYDVNPFSVPSKRTYTESKENKGYDYLRRQGPLPALNGATSMRKDAAKQTVMREKSFTDKRAGKRKETRTVIKGVRTNRRFELQMQMRNIN